MNHELIDLLRALVGDGCPTDGLEHCHYCGTAGEWVARKWQERHEEDCPYLRASQYLAEHDANQAAIRQLIGAGI